jgi:hypothetical protein
MNLKITALAFCAGIGFMASQELWWAITGMVGFCHG